MCVCVWGVSVWPCEWISVPSCPAHFLGFPEFASLLVCMLVFSCVYVCVCGMRACVRARARGDVRF